jgi:hypothetical protein
MERWRWRGFGIVDVLYTGVCGGFLIHHQPTRSVGIWMAIFALFIVFISWLETRQLIRERADSRRRQWMTVGMTVLLLGIWLVFASLPPTELSLYFALLAGFFFLQAVRDAAVLDLSPIELVLEGYVNLVAVYIVLGAAADAIDRFQVALLGIAFFVYFVRKSFQWTGTALAWFRGK